MFQWFSAWMPKKVREHPFYQQIPAFSVIRRIAYSSSSSSSTRQIQFRAWKEAKKYSKGASYLSPWSQNTGSTPGVVTSKSSDFSARVQVKTLDSQVGWNKHQALTAIASNSHLYGLARGGVHRAVVDLKTGKRDRKLRATTCRGTGTSAHAVNLPPNNTVGQAEMKQSISLSWQHVWAAWQSRS